MSRSGENTGPPEGPSHVYTVRVRPSDTDHQRVVHASRYTVFLEAAMIEAMRAAGCWDVMHDSSVDLVLAEINLRYLAPARFDELLEIAVWRRHLGTTSLVVDFEGSVGDRPVVTAWARYVAFSLDKQQKTPIPDSMRQSLDALPQHPPTP